MLKNYKLFFIIIFITKILFYSGSIPIKFGILVCSSIVYEDELQRGPNSNSDSNNIIFATGGILIF